MIKKKIARRISTKSSNKKNIEEEGTKSEDENENNQNLLVFQPLCIKGGILKKHQIEGLNWMINLNKIGTNGILADQMGLGKTIQTISLLGYMREKEGVPGPHLIVAPLTTLGNWVNEFKKWMPCARVVKLMATMEQREEVYHNLVKRGKFDVLITSYEGLNISSTRLSRIKWNYIIVDEAHRMKNSLSNFSVNMRMLKSSYKLLLTGTPLQNNIKELWSLLNFCNEKMFNDPELFEQWFDEKSSSVENNQKEKQMLVQKLHDILSPYILRRIKQDTDLKIPPKKEVLVYVKLSEIQLKLYKNILIHNKIDPESQKKSNQTLNNTLMQLRKVCLHPYLFEEVEPENFQEYLNSFIEVSSKLKLLDRMLDRFKGGHKVLIFSQFTSMLDILEFYCRDIKKFKYFRLDGQTDHETRNEEIEAFNNDDTFIYLISSRAGGLGINLKSADTVIIYDSDWNPQIDLQAMDRAHRIGQKKKVMVYRLVIQDTVEEKIIERQTIKLKWDYLIIEKGRFKNSDSERLNQVDPLKMTAETKKDLTYFGANMILKADYSKSFF